MDGIEYKIDIVLKIRVDKPILSPLNKKAGIKITKNVVSPMTNEDIKQLIKLGYGRMYSIHANMLNNQSSTGKKITEKL